MFSTSLSQFFYFPKTLNQFIDLDRPHSMNNCQKIIDLIRQGDEVSLKEGMELLYKETDLKQAVVYNYEKFKSQLAPLLSWDDLFHDTLVRITNEIRQGRGAKIKL